MANTLSPNATVTRTRKGPASIAPSRNGTVGAIVGFTLKGNGVPGSPVSKPVAVRSLTEYQMRFGGPTPLSTMYEQAQLFFQNCGKQGGVLYVSRALHYTNLAVPTTYDAVSGTLQLQDSAPANDILVTASSPGEWSGGYKITTRRKSRQITTTVTAIAALATVDHLTLTSGTQVQKGDLLSFVGAETIYAIVTSVNGNIVYFASTTSVGGGVAASSPVNLLTFNLTVITPSGSVERTYPSLRMSALAGANYFVNVVNNSPYTQILLTDQVVTTVNYDSRPADVTALPLAGGSNGTAPTDADLVGSSVGKTGIYAYDRVDGFGMLAVPGKASATVTGALIDYAESRQKFLALLDFPINTARDAAVTFVNTTVNKFSSYAAIMFGWLKMLNPDGSGAVETVPPIGAWMGVMARTDQTRGPWKAPAGLDDGRISGILGIEQEVLTEDYNVLYPQRINAIQEFVGEGTCVMGNVTLDPTTEFQEIGVCRLFLFVEASVEQSTRRIMFEGSNETTWANNKRLIKAFLRDQVWLGGKNGGLVGKTEDQAFFVICDSSNNTVIDQQNRRINTRIGMAPVHAGEFVETTTEQDTSAYEAALAGGA